MPRANKRPMKPGGTRAEPPNPVPPESLPLDSTPFDANDNNDVEATDNSVADNTNNNTNNNNNDNNNNDVDNGVDVEISTVPEGLPPLDSNPGDRILLIAASHSGAMRCVRGYRDLLCEGETLKKFTERKEVDAWHGSGGVLYCEFDDITVDNNSVAVGCAEAAHRIIYVSPEKHRARYAATIYLSLVLGLDLENIPAQVEVEEEGDVQDRILAHLVNNLELLRVWHMCFPGEFRYTYDDFDAATNWIDPLSISVSKEGRHRGMMATISHCLGADWNYAFMCRQINYEVALQRKYFWQLPLAGLRQPEVHQHYGVTDRRMGYFDEHSIQPGKHKRKPQKDLIP